MLPCNLFMTSSTLNINYKLTNGGGLRIGANVTKITATFSPELNMLGGVYYPINQNNGQRIFGPPSTEEPIERQPDYRCEIFITHIPSDVFEDTMIPLVAKYGDLYTYKTLLNFKGQNRGYGYARYKTIGDAQFACIALHNLEVAPGRRIQVKMSVNNNGVFIGNLSTRKFSEDFIHTNILPLLSGVKAVTFFEKSEFDRFSIIIEFFDHSDAALYRRTLVNDKNELFGFSNVIINWTDRAFPHTQPSVQHTWPTAKDFEKRINVKTTILSSPRTYIKDGAKSEYY